MGHIHLGTLPRSKPWNEVVSLLSLGADVEDIAAASARAAEAALLKASSDALFVEAVRLLINIPLAARKADFGDALRALDLDVRGSPGLMDVFAALSKHLDGLACSLPGRSDFSEIASRALIKTLTDCVGRELPSLFGPTDDDVRLAFKKFSGGPALSVLCQEFFGAVVTSSLSYWLDRTLADHIGEGKRFNRINDRSAFDGALDQHVIEATRIIKEFSGGWVGKTAHPAGKIGQTDALRFGHVCLKKVVEELRVKRGQDA